MIYNTSRGTIKTITFVQTGVITKRKTGSKFIINFLNHVGHSISYDEVNLVETYFAEQQIDSI